MDENLELLEYIYQTADMGTKSLNNLLNDIKDKDNKIKKIVSEQLKGYEKYLKEAKELLKKHDTKPKGKGIMADIMSKMGIKKEIKEDMKQEENKKQEKEENKNKNKDTDKKEKKETNNDTNNGEQPEGSNA